MKTNNGKELPLLRILLVEDNEHDRVAFHRAFKKAQISYNYDITEFERAEHAMEQLSIDTPQFDILVADYMMPGMTGLDFCKELIKKKISMPMIILTGTGSEQLAVDALKAGIDDYIVKDPGQGYLKLLPVVLPEVVRKYSDNVKRKQAEDALRESESRFSLFMKYFPGVAFINSSEGTTVFGNKLICEFYGCTPEEYIGKKFEELAGPEIAAQMVEQDRKVLSEGNPVEIEELIPDSSGPKYWLTCKFPIHYEDRTSMIGGLSIDITKRKWAEEILRKENFLSEEYINSLPGLFYVFDEERFVKWNKQWEIVSGYSAQELDKMYGTDFFRGTDKTLIADRMKEVFVKGASEAEAYLVTKNGKRIPYYLSGLRKEFDGKPHLVGLGIDITDLKHAEEELVKALQEKKDLLSELQHRAKNSFAMICSMISLAVNASASDDARTALSDIGSRVMAVAEVYDLLYTSDSVTDVRLDEYLIKVVYSLSNISGNITLKNKCDSIITPVKTAIPVGIIITELITNSIKHAFPDNRKGTIDLSLKKTKTGAQLEVKDNGAGLPEGFDISAADSLGLKLVDILVDQIGGSYKFENKNGTRCHVDFPIVSEAM